MWKEFREFAVKGNVVDLAIGIVIGTAFGKIVSSLVDDVIMPPFSLLLGRVNFANLYINLSGKQYNSLSEAKSAGAVTINYGAFINNIITFVLVAFALFLVVKQINRVRRIVSEREEKQEKVTHKDCPYCFMQVPVKATRCPLCTSLLK